jgi:hypothetical protein
MCILLLFKISYVLCKNIRTHMITDLRHLAERILSCFKCTCEIFFGIAYGKYGEFELNWLYNIKMDIIYLSIYGQSSILAYLINFCAKIFFLKYILFIYLKYYLNGVMNYLGNSLHRSERQTRRKMKI